MTAARMIDQPFGEGLETVTQLVRDERFTGELADAIRKEGGMERVFAALQKEFFPVAIEMATPPTFLESQNPFDRPVPEILRRLREAAEQQGWNIREDAYEHLTKTVPARPNTRLGFRSLRIRFGKGDAGVSQTFEAHVARFKKTFGKYWRNANLASGITLSEQMGEVVEQRHLCLLVGNERHKPVIEWCTFDLGAHQFRGGDFSVVRGPKSLADEGLVFTWLFPEYANAIDYEKYPGYFLAGYVVPGRPRSPHFTHLPSVNRDTSTGQVRLRETGCHTRLPTVNSVPFLLE